MEARIEKMIAFPDGVYAPIFPWDGEWVSLGEIVKISKVDADTDKFLLFQCKDGKHYTFCLGRLYVGLR